MLFKMIVFAGVCFAFGALLVMDELLKNESSR